MLLPHTRDFTRHGCTVGARLITYLQLEEWFVCNSCGGSVVHHIKRIEDHTVDWAECGQCGGRDFVSLGQYERQLAVFPDVVAGLPEDLKVLFAQPSSTITAAQAIAELYDL